MLKWTLDDSPPAENARHHIKEASFYGIDTWSVDLVIKIPEPIDDDDKRDARARGALDINFMGIQEAGMWPGKMRVKEQGGPAMLLFEKFDAWVDKRTNGNVDAMLIGTVGGVVTV